MKIYTRRGDEGETSLLGGVRVDKADARVTAYGTVDELNASVGLALAVDEDTLEDDATRLERVQDDLFAVGARLAAADLERARRKGLIPDFPPRRIDDLESWIDELEEDLPELDAFIHPGGSPTGAHLHAARTVCRRAERAVVTLADERPELEEAVLPYLNRLSDLLFTLARAVNLRAGTPEVRWKPVRERGGPGSPTRDRDPPETPGAAPDPDDRSPDASPEDRP